MDGGGFGSQHMGHFQHGDFVALLSQIHTGLHADFAAADDDHIVAHGLRVDHGLGGNHDMGLVQTGDGGLGGGGAQRGDDHVKPLRLDHLGGGAGVELHVNGPLFHLMDQVLLEVAQRPLEGDKVGVIDRAAQMILRLVERDLVAAVAQVHGGFHTGGAAADHGDAHTGLSGRLQHIQTVLNTDPGVDGADGHEGIVGAAAVALVAAQAGHQIVCPALLHELDIVGIGDKGAGGGDDVHLALGHSGLHIVEVMEAADAGNLHLQALFLGVFRILQERRVLLLKGDGVVGIGLTGAELDDVHIGLGHLQELDALVHGVAALGLLAGEQDLHDHVPSGSFPDLLETHQGELGAVIQAAAVLVLAGVGQRGEELGGQLAAVAQVDGHHIKVKEFQDLDLLSQTVGDELHVLGSGVQQRGLDGAGHHIGLTKGIDLLFRQRAGVGDVAQPQDLKRTVGLLERVAGGRADKETHAGHGAVIVDGVSHLHQVVLAGGIVEVKIGEVGEVGLHGDDHIPGEVVDAHAGDDGRARLGFVGVMGDDALGGEGFVALQEVGQRVGDLQPVLQHMAADDQRGEDMGILAHRGILLLRKSYSDTGRKGGRIPRVGSGPPGLLETYGVSLFG